MVDIATGWCEGEVIPDRTQSATFSALDRIRQRLPFHLRELHPDNDTAILNELLIDYSCATPMPTCAAAPSPAR